MRTGVIVDLKRRVLRLQSQRRDADKLVDQYRKASDAAGEKIVYLEKALAGRDERFRDFEREKTGEMNELTEERDALRDRAEDLYATLREVRKADQGTIDEMKKRLGFFEAKPDRESELLREVSGLQVQLMITHQERDRWRERVDTLMDAFIHGLMRTAKGTS